MSHVETPNIGLQRIRLRSVPELRRDKLSACGLAAELGSFGTLNESNA